MSADGTSLHPSEGQRRAAAAIMRARRRHLSMNLETLVEKAIVEAVALDIDFYRGALQRIALNSYEAFARQAAESALRAPGPIARSGS